MQWGLLVFVGLAVRLILMSIGSRQDEFIGTVIGHYACVEVIGVGGFCTVYKAVSERNGLIVAIKIIDKRQILAERNLSARRLKQKLIRSEAEIMAKCNSKHVVRLYDRYETQHHIMLVLEYCNGGDLAEEINTRGRIPEAEAIRILQQIILGFAELHRMNIVHRDLKSNNIFRHNGVYKIGDLGLATIVENLQVDSLSSFVGTVGTIAPELLNRQTYGSKADIWSLGIVYYEMLFGEIPKLPNLMGKVDRVELDLSGISPQSRGFLQRALVPNPTERISWSQIYGLPILNRRSHEQDKIYDFKERTESLDLKRSLQIHLQVEEREKTEERDIEKELKHIESEQANPVSYEQISPTKHPSRLQYHRARMLNREAVDRAIEGYVQELHFQTEKVLLLMSQIAEALIRKDNGLTNSRSITQLAFLVCKKCLAIVSPINEMLTQRTNIFQWEYFKEFLESKESFQREFKVVYGIVRSKLDELDKLVLEHENGILARVHDRYKQTVYSKQYNRRNTLINGIEGSDFTEEEQLQFVTDEYITPILESITLSPSEHEPERSISHRLRVYLSCYRELAQAKYDPRTNILKSIVQSKQRYLMESDKLEQ